MVQHEMLYGKKLNNSSMVSICCQQRKRWEQNRVSSLRSCEGRWKCDWENEGLQELQQLHWSLLEERNLLWSTRTRLRRPQLHFLPRQEHLEAHEHHERVLVSYQIRQVPLRRRQKPRKKSIPWSWFATQPYSPVRFHDWAQLDPSGCDR